MMSAQQFLEKMSCFYGVKQRSAEHRLNEFPGLGLASLYFAIKGLLLAVSLSIKGFKAVETLFLSKDKKTWHAYCDYRRPAAGENYVS